MGWEEGGGWGRALAECRNFNPKRRGVGVPKRGTHVRTEVVCTAKEPSLPTLLPLRTPPPPLFMGHSFIGSPQVHCQSSPFIVEY